MPTQSWRKSLSVVERLRRNPAEFSAVQAVRILERAAVYAAQKPPATNTLDTPTVFSPTRAGLNPVARFAPPHREIIRFLGSSSLGFPSSEIPSQKGISQITDNNQWQLAVNFVGIVGAMGVMPYHYSETILQRLKQRDESLRDFINLFNHRLTSLFFQASVKYHLPIEYERSKLFNDSSIKPCHHTQSLVSLLGLGTTKLNGRQSLKDETLIYYSGLLTQQVRSPSALKHLLNHYFNVPIEIECFRGEWQTLIDDVRTRLASKANPKGQNVCLGRSTMLGRKGWFVQGKSRINIGPLNKEQFELFAPGKGALRALNEMTGTFLGMEQDVDYAILVKRDDVPKKIQLSSKRASVLAWNTWLAGKPRTNTEKDELLEIIVSSKAC